jgi:hypothetical protein
MPSAANLDMKIFQYKVADTLVYADPLEITHKLQKFLGGKAESILNDFLSEDPGRSLGVYERVHHAVHVAFGFVPFDPATGTGTRFEEWNAALEAYLDFFRQSDSATGTSQTAVPPTESAASSPTE